MFKRTASSVLSGFVLISGLVSCKAEKKTVPVEYRTQAQIVRQDGKAEWRNLLAGTLDIQDHLEFSGRLPTKVKIHTSCRLPDGKIYEHEEEFAGSAQIPIHRTIDPKLYTVALNENPADCTLESRAFDDIGSQNIVRTAELRLTDTRPGPVIFARDGDPDANFHLEALKDVRVRFRTAGPAEARLVCQDLTAEAVHFDGVFDAGMFDLKTPALAQAVAVEERPKQLCRVLVDHGGGRDMSRMVAIYFPRAPIIFKDATTLAVATDMNTFRRFISGPYLLGQIIAQNPSPVPRWLRVPSGPMNGILLGFTNLKGKFKSYSETPGNIFPEYGGPTASDGEGWLKLTLAPNSETTLQFYYRHHNYVRCESGALLFGLQMPAVTVEEAGDVGPIRQSAVLQAPVHYIDWPPHGVDERYFDPAAYQDRREPVCWKY